MMFSQSRGGLLNAGGGGDGTQEEDGRHSNGVDQQGVTVTGGQFIQWQQGVIATRQGKEEKLRRETLAVESGGRRVTQLKTDNEQLAGKEEQLAKESKMEEVVLIDTEAQLGFLEKQLHEVGGLSGMVEQMQEKEELVKLEQDSRLRVFEERFRQVQVIMTVSNSKLSLYSSFLDSDVQSHLLM